MRSEITIVMPAYNAVRYIRRTIESVQAQSNKNWKLVVVDDCSSDRTAEIVKGISIDDPRVSLIELKKNFGGPAGPRNVGVSSAETELIAFLDADDIWHPDKLSIQLKIQKAANLDLVCSSVCDFYDESTIRFSTLKNSPVERISYFAERMRNQIPTSSVIARTALARKFPFNEAISYRAVEDYDAWLRMLESGARCLKVKAPLVMYRKVEGQISGSKWQMTKKVLMLHRNRSGVFTSYLYTLTHLIGAFYTRVLLKRM